MVKYYNINEMIANVIIAIPIGFMIKFIYEEVTNKKVYIIALLLGVSIESLQLLISLIIRSPYRAVDINDIIFNGFGVLIGYYVFYKILEFTLKNR